MIKNLIFDFGKVLVDYDYMPVLRQIFGNDDDANRFAQRVLTEQWGKRMDREDVSFEQSIRDMQDAFPEYYDQITAFGERYPDFVTGEMPGMNELLQRLKSQGFAMYGLSNWCSKVHITMKQYDIFKYIDGFVVSSQIREIKPDAPIYRHLLDKYGLDASECFFADDRAENVDGAKAVGIDGVVFVDAAQYEQALRDRGII
ncbi:MAG: HAD family phosphatase [Bacteroidales bacterium]|nr:HAD family phosphatase [Bacteroidales bacterium]